MGQGDDEVDLVMRAQADPRAFAALYERYFDSIYLYCLRRVADPETAADATSLVFAKALAALPRYRSRSFRSWLFTIAHNVVIDTVRRRRLHVPLDAADAVIDEAPTPEEHALTEEEHRSLDALLSRLPPTQRQIVELRLAGLTGPEIADVLGSSLSAIKAAQFRAYTRLRRLLAFDAAADRTEVTDATP